MSDDNELTHQTATLGLICSVDIAQLNVIEECGNCAILDLAFSPWQC